VTTRQCVSTCTGACQLVPKFNCWNNPGMHTPVALSQFFKMSSRPLIAAQQHGMQACHNGTLAPWHACHAAAAMYQPVVRLVTCNGRGMAHLCDLLGLFKVLWCDGLIGVISRGRAPHLTVNNTRIAGTASERCHRREAAVANADCRSPVAVILCSVNAWLQQHSTLVSNSCTSGSHGMPQSFRELRPITGMLCRPEQCEAASRVH